MKFAFSKREIEILKLKKEGVKSHEVIRQQLGMKDKKQVSVHLTNARRKVVASRKFARDAMREYSDVLFPGTKKKYKNL